MSASLTFNKSVGALITGGPLFAAIMDGAREVGLRTEMRAPGVVLGVHNTSEYGIGQP